jgi:hypothetical protein
LQDDNVVAVYEIDEPVFFADTARPGPGESSKRLDLLTGGPIGTG